ncbi:hypothetical protein GNF10_35330 [Nostoc sp. UCD121]|nr:hypothetical protein [Nostoc sp. UCD121]MBC1281059.1 hypothetical protein [Nostoc sp. UCD121]MBC1299915.1 hypothetical protein [Nostoc sp. UCD122]
MNKQTILFVMFSMVFVVLAMRSVVDTQAQTVLLEYSKLFFAGYLGYLLK